ncbi:MAG: hypothetical protein IJ757_04265 [Clostridiales bacterium]|nr:hypothetical protein [Clostridiales bacterium]
MRKTLISLLLIASLGMCCISFSGCNKEEEAFPSLAFEPAATTATPSSEEELQAEGLHELTVALPLTDDTVELLMKLYYAKNNGLFPMDMTGADISLEYLNAINTPIVVNSITSATSGETEQILGELNEEGMMPDVFLASDIDSLISSNTIISLDQYLSDDSVNASQVYLGTLESLREGGEHYGLPFYTTVELLTGSREYLPESGVPSFNISEEELITYLRSIPAYNSDGTVNITRFYNAESLIPYLDEEYASTLISDGLSSDTDSMGADPRVSRACGMWLMNSGEFETWSNYYPNGLYFTMLPSEHVYATVYPVCVSSSCADPDFASDFISFICFDRDAQMLLRRLEPLRGFFPPVSYDGVWNELSDDEDWGPQAMLYEQFMSSADYSVAVN